MLIDVAYTNDQKLDATENRQIRPRHQVITYLNEDPRHAVIIHGTTTDTKNAVDAKGTPLIQPLFRPQFIFRGAGEDPNNFYYGEMPAEDPNDANGGDLTADRALDLVIAQNN